MISLEEIKEKQEELNKMIEEYKKQDKKEDNLISTWNKNWKPKDTERFYFVNSYKRIDYIDYADGSLDEVFIYNNRIFRIYEQAEKWREIDTYLREKSFNPDWKDRNQTKYSLSYDVKKNEFYFEYCFCLNSFAPFYFEYKELLGAILKKYSTEELKFYFNI